MRTSKIQNGPQGAPKKPTGSGKGYTPKFLGAPVNFCKISFLIRAILLWENVAMKKKWRKNGNDNGGNSSPLGSLSVDRMNGSTCNRHWLGTKELGQWSELSPMIDMLKDTAPFFLIIDPVYGGRGENQERLWKRLKYTNLHLWKFPSSCWSNKPSHFCPSCICSNQRKFCSFCVWKQFLTINTRWTVLYTFLSFQR